MTIENTTEGVDFPVVGSFSQDVIPKISAQRTINMYEVFSPQGKKQNYLAPTPGLELPSAEPPAVVGVHRAAIVFFDPNDSNYYMLMVVGNSVFRIDQNLTATNLVTTFTTSTGYVGVAATASQILLVDGTTALLYNIASGALAVQPITDDNLSPIDATMMDGYFIVAIKDSINFYISGLNDGTTWNSPDFASITSAPTVFRAITRLKRRLFLFGDIITEVWLDAGTSGFPFRRDNNLLFEHGVESAFSVQEGFERVFYLSRDQDGVGAVMMIDGLTPKPISTREIDELIQSFDTTNDASGLLYKINGQIFYQLNFTAENRTIVYNLNTDKWHEMLMMNDTRHLGQTHAFFKTNEGEAHFMGSYLDNKFYRFGEDIFVNNDQPIKRIRICHVLSSPTYNRIRIDRLQLDMLQGALFANPTTTEYAPENVDTTVSDNDPVIYLYISENGGISYQFMGTAPIGELGQYTRRTIWRRLGVRRDAILKFEIYNTVKAYILGGAIYYKELPE